MRTPNTVAASAIKSSSHPPASTRESTSRPSMVAAEQVLGRRSAKGNVTDWSGE